jgi:hypothetical protein
LGQSGAGGADGTAGSDGASDASDAANVENDRAVSSAADVDAGDALTSDVADTLARPSLPSVAPAHLQLWLTADSGVDCVGSSPARVHLWSDGSSHHRDATSGSHLGPRCGEPLHTMAGASVPYFSAPAGGPPFVDDSLDVDLSFLSGVEYTLFVVERRWSDRDPTGGALFIGTQTINETSPPTLEALQVGYVFWRGYTQLSIDLTGYGTQTPMGAVPALGSMMPAAATLDMFRFSHAAGLEVWVDGKLATSRAGDYALQGPLSAGSIGRATYLTRDLRYVGDIAEIIVFDAALVPNEQVQIENYLREHWKQPFAPPF